MTPSKPRLGSTRWHEYDVRRNEAARREMLRRDGRRHPSENLAEGIALIGVAVRNAGTAIPKGS